MRQKGILLEYTSAYSPSQNGKSERMNQTLQNKKMEKTLRKDVREKRLQVEVMKNKGIKVALYRVSIKTLPAIKAAIAPASSPAGGHAPPRSLRRLPSCARHPPPDSRIKEAPFLALPEPASRGRLELFLCGVPKLSTPVRRPPELSHRFHHDSDGCSSVLTYPHSPSPQQQKSLHLQCQQQINGKFFTAKTTMKKTTPAEMKRFFGLLMYMGLVKMPSIPCYWARDDLYKNNIAPSAMSRNRFELLLSMVHFADNRDNPTGSRLHKIQPLVDKLANNFIYLYTPRELSCIDETLVPFRGRLLWTTRLGTNLSYPKNKRHNQLQIYGGKNGDVRTTPASVVMSLAEPILDSGRTLCIDDWYTSMDLALKLIARKTHVVGTSGKNRSEVPKDVTKKTNMKRGDVAAKESKEGITVLNWKDTRNVLMLSSKHTDEMVTIQNKKGEDVKKPAAVIEYNSGKGAVDLSDQMAAYSSPLRKSVKWYRKLGIELLLSTSVVNAYVLFHEIVGRNVKIQQFRENIAKALLDSKDQEEEAAAAPADEVINRPRRVRHELKRRGVGDKSRKYCKRCYETAARQNKKARNAKKVHTYCGDCAGEPAYCLPCFNTVHRNLGA
nr:PREDICTED: piggyBac transposable element-derived protein 1-like [Bemisia tabaci]